MIYLARIEAAVLPLVLEGRWFDLIASGEKREEYRAATKYWRVRLHNWDRKVCAVVPPVVEFRRGYAKDAPRLAFWCMGLETSSGILCYAYSDAQRHPEWGEPRGPHFVIQLGGRVELS